MFLAGQGFVVVNFSYSLAPKVQFTAQLREAALVWGWCAAHADAYHMDLENVFIVGDSAGARMRLKNGCKEAGLL